MTAGPTAAMATLLPTNSPAPMMPPMVIMEMWRGFSERLRAGSAGSAGASVCVRICGEDILYFFNPRGCLDDETNRTTGLPALMPKADLRLRIVLAGLSVAAPL